MTLEERSNLVLALARVLYVNGQSTDETLAAAERLGQTLGLRVEIMPRWGELLLQAEDGDIRLVSAVVADPSGVAMNRAASAMRVQEDLGDGRLVPAAAKEGINAISQAPPAPAWLFALAAGAGAAAPAGIFRVENLSAAALLFLSAAPGGILSPRLARYTANLFFPPFCAALLARVFRALAG